MDSDIEIIDSDIEIIDPDIQIIDPEQEGHQGPEDMMDQEREPAVDPELREDLNETGLLEVNSDSENLGDSDSENSGDSDSPFGKELKIRDPSEDHIYDPKDPENRLNLDREGPFAVIGGLTKEGDICNRWMPAGYGPPYEPGSKAAEQAAKEEAEATIKALNQALAEALAKAQEPFPVFEEYFLDTFHPVVNNLELEYDQSLPITLRQQEVVASTQQVSSDGSPEAPMAQAVPADVDKKQEEFYLMNVIATATQKLQEETGQVIWAKIGEMLRDFKVEKTNLSTSVSEESNLPTVQDTAASSEASESSSPPAKKAKKLEGKTQEGELRIVAVPTIVSPLVTEISASSPSIIDSLDASLIDALNDHAPIITDAPVMVSGQDPTNVDSSSDAAIREDLAAEAPIVPSTNSMSAPSSFSTTDVSDEAILAAPVVVSPLDSFKMAQCARYILLANTSEFPKLSFTEDEKQTVPFWNLDEWRDFLERFYSKKNIDEADFDCFWKAKLDLDEELAETWSKQVNQAETQSSDLHEDDSDMEEDFLLEDTPQEAYRRSQSARYIRLSKHFPNVVFTEEEKQSVSFWGDQTWRKFVKRFNPNKDIEARFHRFMGVKRNLDKLIMSEWEKQENQDVQVEAMEEPSRSYHKRANPSEAGPSSDGLGEGPSSKRNKTDSKENDENYGDEIQADMDMDTSETDDQLAPQTPSKQTTESAPGTSTEKPLKPCYICSNVDRFTGVGRLGCQTANCKVERYDHYVFFETVVSEKGKEKGEQPRIIQYCKNCFNKKKSLKPLMKAAGAKLEHNTEEKERILECKGAGCTNIAHEKCASAYEFLDEFVCLPCLEKSGRDPTREAKATDIRHTATSRNGEEFLREMFPEMDIRLRELNRSQAIAKIRKTCPEQYVEYFDHMKGKTVTSRTLGTFQKNGGKDGMIGALFVDEFSKIGEKNWVVIKYLDTVWPYTKEETVEDEKKWAEIETRGGKAELGEKKISKSGAVGEGLTEWYLGYSRDRGYTHAHLWAKAEEQGSDECFYLHPEHQKYATQEKLEQSCKRLFQKMKDNGDIKDFYSFRERKPEINTIADINKLDAFPHSLWSLMMNWAASTTTKIRSAEKRDARFLTALHGYMDDHMNDNFVIELNPGAKKPDPVIEKDLMLVKFARKPKKLCQFLHAKRMGCNTLRDQQAAAGAVIVEIVTIQDELANVAPQQQRVVVQDDAMEVDQVVEDEE